jgi:hypothetical protein
MLCEGEVAKGLVGPVVVEAAGAGVGEGLELVEAGGQVEAAVELVSPGILRARVGAVELWALGRQLAQGKACLGAGLFELRSDYAPALTWMPLIGDGASAPSLWRSALADRAQAGGCDIPDLPLATGS